MPTYVGTNDYTVQTLLASGAASVTFSADQSLIYVARRDGNIDVYNAATQSLVTNWTVGPALGGISLSEDGSFLLVTRAVHLGTVYRVSTATGTVTSYSTTGQFHDIEIVDATTAIISGQNPMSLNLTTGVFTPLTGAVNYSGSSTVIVEDSHLTLFAEPGISSGTLFLYDDRTGTIVASGDNYQGGVVSGFNWGHQAISEAAGLVVQFAYYGSLNIYDLSLNAIGNIPIGGRTDGLAFSPDGKFLYAYLIDTGVIAKYSVGNWTLVDQYAVGVSSWHNNIGYGDQIHISNDGSYITVADNSSVGALRLIHLTARDEIFAGTAGSDVFMGLDGNDTYTVNHVSDLVLEDAGKGTDAVESFINYMLGANLENLTLMGVAALNGSGNDRNNVITGNAAASSLLGAAGNDRLILAVGASGSTIDGGADIDTLVIGSNIASLAGLVGIEALEMIGGANLTLTGNQFANGLATNTAISGTGSITVNMDTDVNLIASGMSFAGTDVAMVVNGTSGIDIIKLGLGNSGNNTVNGGDGVDQIRGSQRVDTINGDGGNDKIMGLGGADIVTGGSGNDQFRYFSAADSGIGVANSDRITDFAIGEDRLSFALIDADAVTAGDQAFNFIGTAAFAATGVGQIRYTNSGADLLVQADVNGDGIVDMEIILQGLTGGTLTAGDFIL